MKIFVLSDTAMNGFCSHLIEAETVEEVVNGFREQLLRDPSGFYKKVLPGCKIYQLGTYDRRCGAIVLEPERICVYDFAASAIDVLSEVEK